MFEDSAKVGKPPNSTESVAGQNDGFGAKPEAAEHRQGLPLSADSSRSQMLINSIMGRKSSPAVVSR